MLYSARQLTIGDAGTELGFIASIRTMGLYNIIGHVVLLNRQGKMDEITVKKSKAKVVIRVL